MCFALLVHGSTRTLAPCQLYGSFFAMARLQQEGLRVLVILSASDYFPAYNRPILEHSLLLPFAPPSSLSSMSTFRTYTFIASCCFITPRPPPPPPPDPPQLYFEQDPPQDLYFYSSLLLPFAPPSFRNSLSSKNTFHASTSRASCCFRLFHPPHATLFRAETPSRPLLLLASCCFLLTHPPPTILFKAGASSRLLLL